MRSDKTVLVLGGGTGGVVAATRLRQLLPSDDRVILVDRERDHVFQPSLLWLAVNKRTSDQIVRPIDRLERKGIEVIFGDITEIDPEAKRIRVGDTEIESDALVISLGAELAPDQVPGLRDAGHNLYTLEGAVGAAKSLQELQSGRVIILTAAPGYKCPAAPYEAAMLVNDFLNRRSSGNGVRVELFTAEPGPMGTAGPEVSDGVRNMVEAHGVTYHPSHQIEDADPAGGTLKFAGSERTGYDQLIYVPHHRAPAVISNAGLTGESGWMTVDPHTLRTRFPGVYAIGDVTSIPLPSGKPLPKAGVFAHAQAEVVAANLAAEWSGKAPDHAFDGKGACFVETGCGRAAYGSGNFYADPEPDMTLYEPSRIRHLSKVLFEKRWLWKWF